MNSAIVLSGGCGLRMGCDMPKQYMEVKGKMVIMYSLEVIAANPGIHDIKIVAAEKWQEVIKKAIEKSPLVEEKFAGFSMPGDNRQMSIRNGLEDIKRAMIPGSKVLIHDAARPLLTDECINSLFNAINDADGVMPYLPMKDTVYKINDEGKIEALLKRSEIVAGQAPELFDFFKYYDAVMRLSDEEILKINGSSEPAVMAGMKINTIPGDESNFKITTINDYYRFENMIG